MSKKYNSGELQQIIESKDLWKRDYEDLIKSMHKIRRDFIYIPAMSMMANAYQAQFKSSGLLASATFNRLNVNLPKPALNFCLTELVDTIRERQSRYVAYTDYKLPLIKPNEHQIKSLVNDVVEKYAENVTEKLPRAKKYLTERTGLFKTAGASMTPNELEDFAIAYFHLDNTRIDSFYLFHSEKMPNPDL